MNKLVALLRVKDAILFIEEWLIRINELVDEIVIVDNGSTDGTLEILKKHPKVVELEQTVGFDEGRDKVLVYELARKRNPDWCIWLDADEIFENRITRHKLNKLMSSKKITKYNFRLFNFHKDYKHFEGSIIKLMEQSIGKRRLWKEQKSGYFINIKMHNGPIQGIVGKEQTCKYRLKHFGSVDQKYLERKTKLYETVDTNEERKKVYQKHLVQNLPTWKWYEYDENPFKVKIQNTFFYLLYPIAKVYFKMKKLIKKSKK